MYRKHKQLAHKETFKMRHRGNKDKNSGRNRKTINQQIAGAKIFSQRN